MNFNRRSIDEVDTAGPAHKPYNLLKHNLKGYAGANYLMDMVVGSD